MAFRPKYNIGDGMLQSLGPEGDVVQLGRVTNFRLGVTVHSRGMRKHIRLRKAEARRTGIEPVFPKPSPHLRPRRHREKRGQSIRMTL